MLVYFRYWNILFTKYAKDITYLNYDLIYVKKLFFILISIFFD